MRRWIALAFYLTLIIGGCWCTYQWLVVGGRGIIFMAGGFVALFGIYMVWEDFLSPNRQAL